MRRGWGWLGLGVILVVLGCGGRATTAPATSTTEPSGQPTLSAEDIAAQLAQVGSSRQPPAVPAATANVLAARADPLLRAGLDKLSRGDMRGAIQDLEDARVYLREGDPRLAQVDEALMRSRQLLGTQRPGTSLPTTGEVGMPIESGNWRYVVGETGRSSAEIGLVRPKGVWQTVKVRVENIGSQTYPINAFDFELRDSSGLTYKADMMASSGFSRTANLSAPGGNFPPRVPADVGLAFDINPAATGLQLYLVQAKRTVALQ